MSQKVSLFPYVGSKKSFLEYLYQFFPKDYNTYLEPFGGSFSVVLNNPKLINYLRKLIPKSDVPSLLVNDFNEQIFHVANTILFQKERLLQVTKSLIYSEQFRMYANKINSEPLLDSFQKAVLFLYKIQTTFGSKLTQHSMAFKLKSNMTKTYLFTEKDLDLIFERLSYIRFFCLEWDKFLERFYKPDKEKINYFIYLDPPYWDKENLYEESKGFDHFKLYDFLERIKDHSNVKFLLSYNNVQPIQDLYCDFQKHTFEVNYSVGAKDNSTLGEELLISNYKPNILKVKKLNSFI